MIKAYCVRRLLIAFTTYTLALSAMALPEYESTKLPMPDLKLVPEADYAMLKEVIALEVHKDSKDPSLYYYVPPFHIRQYKEGAASLLLHTEKISEFAQAKKVMKERENFTPENNQTYKEEIKEAEMRIRETQLKLAEALTVGNQAVIELFREILNENKKALTDLKLEIGERNKAAINRLDRRASLHLAFMGHDVDLRQCVDSNAAFQSLKESAFEASTSYGGFLSFNSYAGFTKGQLDALRLYRTKYIPDVKVVLLPLEALTFNSLTETQYDPHLGSKSSKLFTRVQGAGDYLGTTLVLDTTVAGSVGLANHLQPFIVPIGIEATYKQKSEPFDAEIKCDFSNGFTVKGRADVKDGLVIYDNDIINTMKTEDINDGDCAIKIFEGDQGSAQYAALEELNKEFTKMHLNQATLSYEEKQKYYHGVLADIQQNRHNSSKKSELIRTFILLGIPGIALTGLSYASDFHWHTNIQDVENISKFKFHKRITLGKGVHKSVKRNMPVNLCLVYNRSSKAYDRCTDEEFKKAQTMQIAMETIEKSDECKNASDPWECATNRDATDLLPSRDSSTPLPRDNMLTGAI